MVTETPGAIWVGLVAVAGLVGVEVVAGDGGGVAVEVPQAVRIEREERVMMRSFFMVLVM